MFHQIHRQNLKSSLIPSRSSGFSNTMAFTNNLSEPRTNMVSNLYNPHSTNTFMQTGLTQSSDVQSSVPNIVLPRLGNVMGNFDKIKRIIEGPGDHDS